MGRLKMVFVVLLSILEVVDGQALELAETCPVVYTIRKPDGDNLRVDLYEKKDCSKVDKVRKQRTRNGYNANEDLQAPHMTPVAMDGNYLLNIDLQIAPGADGAYPKKLFLELVSYNRTDHDKQLHKKCLLFKISNTTANPYWSPLKLPMTCLELVDDITSRLMLSSQVWTFPGHHSSRICRQKRSSFGSKTCGVHCSHESMYPLSLAGENEYELCTCADKNRFNSTFVYLDEQLIIRLEGLPPLIGTITVKVSNRSGDVYEGSINTSSFKEGRGEYTVTKKLAPGNYSFYFDGQCKFSREVDFAEMDYIMGSIKMVCGNSFGDIHAVAYYDILDEETSLNSMTVMLGVLAGISLVVLVTSVTFFILQRRRKSCSSGMPINNVNIEMQHKMTESTIASPLLATEGPLQQETCLEDMHDSVEDTNTVHSLKQNLHTMILSHPDSDGHMTNVKCLTKKLHDEGVVMVHDNNENWRNYAEGAVDCQPNIVIFLSPGLVKLCACYKDKENPAMENEEFKKLIRKRNFEYTPCIVMDKIRLKLHENPERKDFCVHLISICDSLENGEKLKTSFYQVHDFLKITNNVHSYCFTQGEDTNTEKLVSNISSLS